jgi:DNA-directed RNA polymerase subunit RPC12/RpoP
MIYFCQECDTRKNSDFDVATFTPDDKPVCSECWYRILESKQEQEQSA